MKTFEEWIIKNHPEVLDENWRQSMGALALGAASLIGNYGDTQAAEPVQARQSASIQTVDANQQQRIDAIKRVARTHRFKKNWGSKFTLDQDQKLIDTMLQLKTDQDHDRFMQKISSDMGELVDFHMKGKHHPDSDINKQEIRQIQNSYEYQYMDYIKTLATASKINL
jgi:hypothetical protein